MKTLFIFPFLPFPGARALRAHPRWLVPFLVLAVLHIALLIFSERETVNSVIAHLPPGAIAADREEVGSILNATRLTQYMFEPVRLLTGWSAFAGLLYLFIRSLSPPGPVTFVRILTLEVHAEAVLVIGSAAMRIPFLNAISLLPATSPYPLVALLATLNIFTLWYVVLLATGMRVLFGMPVRAAALVAAGAWALSVLFDTAILTLLVTTLHLRV